MPTKISKNFERTKNYRIDRIDRLDRAIARSIGSIGGRRVCWKRAALAGLQFEAPPLLVKLCDLEPPLQCQAHCWLRGVIFRTITPMSGVIFAKLRERRQIGRFRRGGAKGRRLGRFRRTDDGRTGQGTGNGDS